MAVDDSNVPEGAACSMLTTLPATASKPTMKPTIIGEKIGIVSLLKPSAVDSRAAASGCACR